MMRIYIAGPLNSDAAGYIKNLHRMIQVGNVLRLRGFSPFVPCLDILIGIFDGKMGLEDYLEMNLPWVKCADALFVIAHSPGTDKEIDYARANGVPVFHTLEELLEYRRQKGEK